MIYITPPEMIINVKINFVVKVPMGILDYRPLKSVVGKQSVEKETLYYDISLVGQNFHNVKQSDDIQMLK